jgi:hypothetical protein
MSVAFIQLKPLPAYRSDAFAEGLKKLGYSPTFNLRGPEPGGVFVAWNLHGSIENQAEDWRRAGGKVLVAENGFVRGQDGKQTYSLARDGHNGSGKWYVGGPERWEALGIKLRPWQSNPKGHILVVGQRGIGSKAMRSPSNWERTMVDQLARLTRLRIQLRAHPGRPAQEETVRIKQDLQGACCCVIWSSATGVRALIEGIPVFQFAPAWVCSDAAGRCGVAFPPVMDDALRLQAMVKMSWAQWNTEELATGEPMRRLIELE